MPEDFTDEIYEGTDLSIKEQKFFQEDKTLLKILEQKEVRPIIEYNFDLTTKLIMSEFT